MASNTCIDNLVFQWQRTESLTEAVGEIYREGNFSDLHILSEENILFKSHQFVLARHSKLLQTLFQNPQCPCGGGSHGCCNGTMTLILDQTEPIVIQRLLDLIYLGTCIFETEEEKNQLSALLSRLDMPVLQNLLSPTSDTEEEVLEFISESEAMDIKMFECCKCFFQTPSKVKLLVHSFSCAENKLQQPQSVMSISQYAFEMIKVKEEPLEIQEDESLCHYCPYTCANDEQLLRHYCLNHFKSNLEKAFGHLPACPCCGKAFEGDNHLEDLILHLGIKHGKVKNYLKYCVTTDRDLSCVICPDFFETPQEVLQHLGESHYQLPIDEMYPNEQECLICGCSTNGDQNFYRNHLIQTHGVLFKLGNDKVIKQLNNFLSIGAIEVIATGPGSEIDNPFESFFTCPVCDKSFQEESLLKEDLAKHYWSRLKDRFSCITKQCMTCEFEGISKDSVLLHTAVAHGGLNDVLPALVRKLVEANTNINVGDILNNGTDRESVPPAQTFKFQRRRISEGKQVKCPACPSMISSISLQRHIATTHMRHILRKFVDENKRQCLKCMVTFNNKRYCYEHVAKVHGFLKRFLKKQRQKGSVRNDEKTTLVSQIKTETKELKFTDTRVICPACSLELNSKGLPRHIAIGHLKSTLVEFVDDTKSQCLKCSEKFRDNHACYIHVARKHGFITQFLKNHKQTSSKSEKKTLAKSKSSLGIRPKRQRFVDKRVNCPVCNIEINSKGVHRHIALAHLRKTVSKYVDETKMQCLKCLESFSDKNVCYSHVGRVHGFVKRFLKTRQKTSNPEKEEQV